MMIAPSRWNVVEPGGARPTLFPSMCRIWMHVKIAMKSGILMMTNHNIFSKCMSGMHKLKILMRGAMESEVYIFEMIVFSVIAPCNNMVNNIPP